MKLSLRDEQRRLTKNIGSKILWSIEDIIASRSLVGCPPIFDPELFPWTRDLEENLATIRGELGALLMHQELLPNFQDISHDQTALTNDDGWKTYFLYGFGKKSEHNCARCPQTTRLVESIPGMTSACFSILGPNKHVPEHRGPYKGVLRYHLPLLVPEPRQECRMRIVDTFVSWEAGRSIVFDDTYPHEVWNDTDGVRVVLFLDFRRPLPPAFDWINRRVIQLIAASPYISHALENDRAWSARFDAAVWARAASNA